MTESELMHLKDFRDQTTTGIAILDERSKSHSKALDQIAETVKEIATGDHCVKGRMHDNDIETGKEERARLWKEIKGKKSGNGNGNGNTRNGSMNPATWAAVFWQMIDDPRKRGIVGLCAMAWVILKVHGIDPITLVAKLVDIVKAAKLIT